MTQLRTRFVALALVAGALCWACGSAELASHWRDREIAVDGKLDDWEGLQTALAAKGRKTDSRIGVVNDGEAIYLSLETADPTLARLISHRGLTVWLDPAGGQAQTLGVRFPLPAARPLSRWGEIGGSAPGGAQLDRLELLGPEPYTRKELSAPGADGVQVALGAEGGRIAYELRVPIAVAQAWGLRAGPGAKIGVGLVSRGMGARPMRRRGEGPGRGGPPDDGDGDGDRDGRGQPPEGDGPPGTAPGPGGPGGPGRQGPVRDFEAWAVVHLAPAPG
jgi:hypothetical protein